MLIGDDAAEAEELRDEDVDREGSDNEVDAGDEDGGAPKLEYVRKDFFARPYASPFGTDGDVKNLIV